MENNQKAIDPVNGPNQCGGFVGTSRACRHNQRDFHWLFLLFFEQSSTMDVLSSPAFRRVKFFLVYFSLGFPIELDQELGLSNICKNTL